jgi:ABC-2 type transport system ATP-binding protein
MIAPWEVMSPYHSPASTTRTSNSARSAALDGLDLESIAASCSPCSDPTAPAKSTAISLLLGLQTSRPRRAELLARIRSPSMRAAHRRDDAGDQSLARDASARDHRADRELLPEPYDTHGRHQALGIERSPIGPTQALGRPEAPGAVRMAICGRPELLFLDEPTVGLDVQRARRSGRWCAT